MNLDLHPIGLSFVNMLLPNVRFAHDTIIAIDRVVESLRILIQYKLRKTKIILKSLRIVLCTNFVCRWLAWLKVNSDDNCIVVVFASNF